MRYAGEVLLSVCLVYETQIAARRGYNCLIGCNLADTCKSRILQVAQQAVPARKRLVCAANEQVALTRFGHPLNRRTVFERPHLDVSCAYSDELTSHPNHTVDVADAFVARVQSSSSCTRVDAPNVQKAILRRSDACEVL